jgi:catechol 2,3-dioxygenase-like lactoylglutathione lyase family enzyme
MRSDNSMPGALPSGQRKEESTMQHPNYVLLFVDNPLASAAFYASIFDCEPLEASPTFALFALSSGVRLGLWSRYDAEPPVIGRGGGSELGIPVADDQALHALYADWKERGLAIMQPPTDMDFGRTFVALDPDGHRLRVFRPGASGHRREAQRQDEAIAA